MGGGGGGGGGVDAVGFACGVERILLALPDEHRPQADPLTVYVIALDEKVFPKAFGVVQKLRGDGIACDMSYKVSSMKSQMRSADKTGSRYVAIIGEEEDKQGIVALKDMRTGEQKEVREDKISELLKG